MKQSSGRKKSVKCHRCKYLRWGYEYGHLACTAPWRLKGGESLWLMNTRRLVETRTNEEIMDDVQLEGEDLERWNNWSFPFSFDAQLFPERLNDCPLFTRGSNVRTEYAKRHRKD